MLTVSRHRHRPLAPRRVMIILRFLRRIAGLGGGPPPPPARQHRRRARARTRQARRIGIQIAFSCHPPRSLTDPLPTRQGFLSGRCRWVTVREFVPTLQPRLYPPIATSRFAGHGRPNCASCADTSAAVRLGRPRQETGSPCRARSAVLQPAAPAERLQRFFDRKQLGGRPAGERSRGGHPREHRAAVASSGASNSTYPSASPNAYQQPCSVLQRLHGRRERLAARYAPQP